MILDTISSAERYYSLHPLMQMFFDYLRTHDLTKVAPGRIVLEGDRLFLNVADSKKQPREERKLEAHRKYIDIQVPLTANETVGWRPLESLDMAPDIAYDEQRDIVFYRQPSSAYIPVAQGQFYLMLPNDAHAPLIGEGPVRKVIGKLRVE